MSRHVCLATAVAALTLCSAGLTVAQNAPPTQKKIYCWNDNGRQVCGDALPANATDNARTEFSIKSGMAIKTVGRTLTDTEQAAADQASETARLQYEAELRKQRHDLAMVEAYMSEDDLRRAYGERMTLLDETLKASRLGVSSLHLSLLSLLRQAGDTELTGTRVDKQLAGNIQTQHTDLLQQRRILASQMKERAELQTDMQDSVQRYRAMKQGQTQSTGLRDKPGTD